MPLSRWIRHECRIQKLVVGLVIILLAAGMGLLAPAYPIIALEATVLTVDKERALQPKDEFSECASGCPLMVVVPAGKFMMGSPKGEPYWGPQHEVTITKPFAVGKYEVTFAEWDACVAAGKCQQVSDNGWGRGNRPVINVSWDEAQKYVTWLSGVTGRPYRLLSEAEWEYAARAGTTTLYSFGDDETSLGEYAWYSANSNGQTHPVGEKKPNAFGLYDIHGNVAEIVQDCNHDSYENAPTDGTAWMSGNCEWHMVRGGGWGAQLLPPSLPSAARSAAPTSIHDTSWIGFRIGRTLSP